jgi:hypothetical protein
MKFTRRKILTHSGVSLAAMAAADPLSGCLVSHRRKPVQFNYPETRRPNPGDAPYSKTPIAASYEERRQMYLYWASKHATPKSRGGVLNDLLKLEAGTIKTPSVEALEEALSFKRDTSDFMIAGLVRLYYLHHADGKLTKEQADGIRTALLGYKYALDEPGLSEAEIWTENHQILCHGSDYLVGQMFPDATFTNDGRTGQQHRDKAKSLVLRWLAFRACVGPVEWDSVPYYNMDIAGLLNLVEFANDSEVQIRATMMVDLLLFDMAVNSFYGQMGTSHGRAYAQNVMSAAGDSLMTLQTLVFGCGRFQSIDMASTMLATSKRYTVPPVLEQIGIDVPEEFVNLERHSIPLTAEAAARYGFSMTDVNDYETWWSMGAFTNPNVINMTYDVIEKLHMWNYPMFRPLKGIGRVLRPLGLLPLVSRMLNPDSNGAVMSEVNKVTYRTPDAMLSTAQDYRPGEKGYQQHIWQATLGPYAVVFVTNPGSADKSGGAGFWTSNGRMPRNAQYRNVLISIYNIQRSGIPSDLQSGPYGFTHAYYPRWAFDEVIERPSSATGGGWVFGRVGDGYIGLYSHLPYKWASSGPESGQEMIADGHENVWICQIGRRKTDGSFASFIQQLSKAMVEVNGLRVSYQAHGTGKVTFGWNEPFTVEGKAIPLHNYPRWDNIYTHMEFGAERFRVEFKGEKLNLDFQSEVRDL